MSQARLPPPAPRCLERPYPSSQKGGTLIAEDVGDLTAHQKRLAHPVSAAVVSAPLWSVGAAVGGVAAETYGRLGRVCNVNERVQADGWRRRWFSRR